MERNVKAWLVMAFLAGYVTEGTREVPNSTKEEVYKPELLGGLLGPAWGLGVVPAVLAAIWPIVFLRLCCSGPGPGWVGSSEDIPHHKGDAAGGYKPPRDGEPKGDAAGGYKPPRDGEPKGDAAGGYKPPRDGESKGDAGGGYKPPYDGEPKGDAAGGYKPPNEGAPKGDDGYGAFMANSSAIERAP